MHSGSKNDWSAEVLLDGRLPVLGGLVFVTDTFDTWSRHGPRGQSRVGLSAVLLVARCGRARRSGPARMGHQAIGVPWRRARWSDPWVRRLEGALLELHCSHEKIKVMTKGRTESPVRKRESFDSVSDFYDKYRTPHPKEVVHDIIDSAHLAAGSRVLEIGCGTGQMSVPLAEHGVNLVAVELGPHLAARARQKLRPFHNARVETSSFEDWTLPGRKFDAVVSASAFHWLDPDTRLTKVAEALSAGGYLAILHVHHVRGVSDFWREAQPFYIKWGLSDDPAFEPTTPDGAPTMYPELDHDLDFSSVKRHRFEIPLTYSTESYIGWLNTDSLVNGLEQESRSGFLNDIGQLIESKHGGEVIRNYVYEVIVAQREA